MVTDAVRRRRRTDGVVALSCWLVATAVLLAVPLLAAADDASSVVFTPRNSLGWWLTVATVTVQAVLLARIGSWPRTALVAVAAVTLPLSVAGTGDSFSVTALPVLLAVYLTAVRLPWRRLRLALAAVTVALVAGVVVNGATSGLGLGPSLGAGALQAVGVVGGALLVAGAVAGRRAAQEASRRELRAVAREHDALVQAAVAQERSAMARELHDIAAHHLSGIALMAAAIERQIDTDPEKAKRSVRQVRAQSTAVLDDLRRLVGLMREDSEAPRSVASLATVSELVEQRRAGGVPVELQTLPATNGRSVGDGLGTLAQLAVYRIAQESMTNAATHAPGAPTVVTLDDRRDDALVLSVTNERGAPVATTAGGFGLVGMQERADLLGAHLRYGPTAGGGWQVEVEVPRDLTGRREPSSSPEETDR